MLLAQDEGVFEVTVRSQTGSVSVPVSFGDGTEIAAMMVENFAKRVDRMENLLNGQILEIGEEISYDQKRNAESLEASQAEAEKVRASQAQYKTPEGQLAIALELVAKHNAQLAQQAAASATPPQKGPGRPKKATTPQPEVMQAAGAMAAQVPMNHGGTGQAVGRAVSLPQG